MSGNDIKDLFDSHIAPAVTLIAGKHQMIAFAFSFGNALCTVPDVAVQKSPAGEFAQTHQAGLVLFLYIALGFEIAVDYKVCKTFRNSFVIFYGGFYKPQMLGCILAVLVGENARSFKCIVGTHAVFGCIHTHVLQKHIMLIGGRCNNTMLRLGHAARNRYGTPFEIRAYIHA